MVTDLELTAINQELLDLSEEYFVKYKNMKKTSEKQTT